MTKIQPVQVGRFHIGQGHPLCLIMGPCVIESESAALFAAEQLKEITRHFGVNLIYKSSYDKANRTSIKSFRGVGLQEGLRILEKVKTEFDFPVLTDIHSAAEAAPVAQVCDVLQIPAFLCRQTDLIVAAAETGAVVKVKKGQFLAPWDMQNIIDKINSVGSYKILLTERGSSFGYNQLVTDMRSIAIMQNLGYPVCFDASHSVQKPGGLGHVSGGERQYIPLLACAAVAAGCNSVFIEAHADPAQGLSDRDSMLPFADLPALLSKLERLHAIAQEQSILVEAMR